MFPPLDPQPEPELTSTAQETVSAQNVPKESENPIDAKAKKRAEEFRQRADVCKTYRRKLIANWTISIDYRRGKPFASQTDEDQVAVNLDWSLTKTKISALFSQVPQVRIDNYPYTLPKTVPWAQKFEDRLNGTLLDAGIETAMDECLPDCINAAGIGVVLVSYEAMTEDRQVPKQEVAEGEDPEMDAIPFALDHRYVVQRLSPTDLLWPVNFTGANFDNAPWIGRTGRITWAEAVQKWGLKEADKAAVLGEDKQTMDRLTHDVERDKLAVDDMVPFDEIFYKEFQYHEDAKSYSTIHHLIFVGGKDEPVVDEPWSGQSFDDASGVVLGAQQFPIRVLTLTYITDETIPPSDSAIGRPQVNEINKARTQMIKQRERSIPVRWFDVNRIDPAIQQSLMRGTWQAMIPVQGEGSRVIGEVAKASMPVENYTFDKIAKSDLQEEWGTPPTGQQMLDSKADPDHAKTNFNAQIGRERAKVGSFFVGIASVLGGLMCLYEDQQAFGEGFDKAFSKTFKFSILADSTVLLDAGQKLSRLNSFINTYAKSGWVNIEPVLQEIASLSGLDPMTVIRPPQPKPPVEPNISLRLTGVEDMLNPLTLAFLIKSGQAPPPEMIEQAKALIQQAVVPPAGMTMPGQVQPMGGLPMLPEGVAPPVPGQPGPGGMPQSGAPLPPPVQGPLPGAPTPPPAPPKMGEAHPNWTVMPALNKRSDSNEK